MARSIILGNGSLLVGLDPWAQVNDLHFPHVGLENHISGTLVHKIGVWVDGALSWLDDGGWTVTINYDGDAMCSNIEAIHEGLGIALHFNDAVYNETDIFIRIVTVTNNRDEERVIKVFFNQQFHISGLARGDTAYFRPDLNALIHYKGRRMFLISGKAEGKYFDDYSTGLLGIEGKEGTWRDAEDGVLEKGPIEHGSVDSVLGFSLLIAPHQKKEITYWIAAGKKYKEIVAMHHDIITRGPHHLYKTTRDFWRAWVNKCNISFCGIDESIISLFKRSLFVIRAHADNNGGIIASSDSSILQYGRDTYDYVWARDGAYTALALSRTGYTDISERFYSFCNDVITDEGYLLHKYRPDRSFGSSWHAWVNQGKAQLPIQEDEAAITLVTLWKHYEQTKDLEFVESIYNSYIKRAADFFVHFRHHDTGLPKPGFNLWEDQYGVFTYTAASVYGALIAAAKFADLLGKETGARRWRIAAEEVRTGILKYLFDEQGKYFIKSLQHIDGKIVTDGALDSSSAYGIFRFGVLDVEDERLVSAMKVTRSALTVEKHIRGSARYMGDVYYQFNGVNPPGNPWFIPSFWAVEYDIACAKNTDDLKRAQDELMHAVSHATYAGMLPEQLDPLTGQGLSASPLVWSHAGFILLVLDYLQKAQEFGLCPQG